MGKTGVLLVNLGTPGSPKPGDVYKYLLEFLLDDRVIDIPDLQRNLLVRGVIVPFRFRKSAKMYRQIWTAEGSPLLVYGEKLQQKLQVALGDGYTVALAMRYQEPGIDQGLAELQKAGVEEIIIMPLFPQYASATTGSIHQRAMEIMKGWQVIPPVKFLNSYFDHPGFISAFVEKGRKYDLQNYGHVIFSFHGLPERQIIKADPHGYCLRPGCCDQIMEKNKFCYRAQCFATARLIAGELNIPRENYTVCFQSRLGKTPWIQPYAEEVLKILAGKGVKKVLAFSPAFVADCLETLLEIGVEYDEEFREMGGEKVQLVESLNDSDRWVAALKEIVEEG